MFMLKGKQEAISLIIGIFLISIYYPPISFSQELLKFKIAVMNHKNRRSV